MKTPAEGQNRKDLTEKLKQQILKASSATGHIDISQRSRHESIKKALEAIIECLVMLETGQKEGKGDK